MTVEKARMPSGGTRITVKTDGNETIKAETSSEPGVPPVTVFWKGRAHIDLILTFFEQHCPYAASDQPFSESLYGALVLSDVARTRLPWSYDLGKVRHEIPVDAAFVRLEHVAADPARSEHSCPDFVVWSTIDVDHSPHDESVPEYVGVAAQPAWLAGMIGHLASFVTETHAEPIRRRIALDSIHSVLHDLTLN